MVDKSITYELTREDFVRAIADLMRPWKVPEGAALGAVRREIEDTWYMRTDSPEMVVSQREQTGCRKPC
jgi:hypothetical protein